MFKNVKYWRGYTTWWVGTDDEDTYTTYTVSWEDGTIEARHIADDCVICILTDIF